MPLPICRSAVPKTLVKNILLGLDRTRFEPYLFIFEEKGEFLDDIKKQGIRVFSSPSG